VKHKDQKPFPVPDFAKLSGDDLLARLGGPSLQQSHLAWQAIADRQMHELAPKLIALVADTSQAAARRIASLWALEGLRRLDAITLMPLLTDANRNLRREAVRAFGEANLPLLTVVAALEPLANDSDPEVRAEVIRTTGKAGQASRLSGQSEPAVLLRATALLTRLARAPLAEPTAKSTHSSKIIKIGEAYDRAFERYLVRMFLERQPEVTAAFLDSDAAQALPPENGLLAALALEPRSSAQQVAKLLPGLTRPAGDEELLRLAQFPDEPGVGDALKAILQRPETRTAALESLLKVRTRLDPAKLAPLLTEVARTLWAGEDDSATMALRLATAFRLAALEEEINDALCCGGTRILKANQHLLAMKAMRALGANLLEGVVAYVNSPDPSLADEAVATLASSRNELAPKFVLWKFWFSLTAPQRRVALDLLAGTRHGAHATVRAIKSGTVDRDELDAATLDKLHAVLGADPELAALMEEMAPLFRPALRLNGEDDAWSDTDITLAGPFTVETWVQLDPGIDNSDGILGAPGVLDLNFFEAKFRVWVGGGAHDVIIATKTAVPDVWIHYAVTRDPAGQFRIYINGELDRADSKTAPQNFEHCRIGWTAPGKGTAGWLTEFRVWNCARTPDEIRAHFDRSFEDAGRDALPRVSDLMHGSRGNATLPPGLVFYAPGSGPWGKLRNGAKIQKTPDFPALLTTAEANALSEKFAKFRALAAQPGDIDRGRALFTTICQQCHSVGGQGGQVGPVLNGAGALGLETLLRNILTPNAAMEPGYRIFRVELEDGDVLDGILVSQDTEALILRRPNVDDVRIPRRATRKAGFAKSSMMPEGLLEALQPEEVTDLLAYLMTLK
jgi:putative heme-binding domain-containing protein